MAGRKEEILNFPSGKDKPKIVTCQACAKFLQEPYILPCIHHICRFCRDQALRNIEHVRTQKEASTSIRCPICEQFASVEDVKPDLVMQKIVDHQMKLMDQNGGRTCEFCKSDSKAAYKCLDCKSDICFQCKSGHLAIPLCVSHTIKPLSDLDHSNYASSEDNTLYSFTRSDEPQALDTVSLCPVHTDKIIEFSCTLCNKAICYKCKVLEHTNHKTQSIGETIDLLMPEMHKKMAVVDNSISCLNDMVKYLESMNLLTKKTKEEFAISIANRKAELMQKLEQDANTVLENTGLVYGAKMTEILTENCKLSSQLATKLALKSRCNLLLCYLQDAHLLQELQGDLMQLLNQHQNYPETSPNISTLKKQICFVAHEGNMIGTVQNETEKAPDTYQETLQDCMEKNTVLEKSFGTMRKKHEDEMQQIHKELYIEKSKSSVLSDLKSDLEAKLEFEKLQSEELRKDILKYEETSKELKAILEECLVVFSPGKLKTSMPFNVFSPPTSTRTSAGENGYLNGGEFESKHCYMLKKIQNVLKSNEH